LWAVKKRVLKTIFFPASFRVNGQTARKPKSSSRGKVRGSERHFYKQKLDWGREKTAGARGGKGFLRERGYKKRMWSQHLTNGRPAPNRRTRNGK